MEFSIFKYKTVDFRRLKAYGFVEKGGAYVFVTRILDGQFEMSVTVSALGEVSATVVDLATDEPYTLHLVAEACGAFVGQVREEFDGVLADIAEGCFVNDVFKDEVAHKLIEYIRETYGDELEFLWEKTPDGAIWRRKDTGKWYALIMIIPAAKLGLGEGKITAVDFRINPATDSGIVDGNRYFAGYHMNKRTWVTAPLDGRVPFEELKEWIDKSYMLAKK